MEHIFDPDVKLEAILADNIKKNSSSVQQYILWFLKTRIFGKTWGIPGTWTNVQRQSERPASAHCFAALPSSTEPVFMMPPSVFPLSPSSLNVSWEKLAEDVVRGRVVRYDVRMISERSPQQSTPVVFSQVLLFSELNYVFILTFPESADYSCRSLPYTLLKWGICFLL